MQVIPLTTSASQSFSVQLAGQDCSIKLYQKSTGLFIDLAIGDRQILQTQICLDRVYLVRYSYLGFIGNLAFFDTQGTDAPYYTGLGDRFVFAYFSADEL